MKVNIKKLHKDAVMPKKGTKGAAAYDLVLSDNYTIVKGRQIIPLDFALEIPYGYEAKIEPRSGHSSKGMIGYEFEGGSYIEERFNCDVMVGKIDSDYRGNIGVIINNQDQQFMMKRGTAIAQITFYKVEDIEFSEVEELSETDRGTGGYGSTGK